VLAITATNPLLKNEEREGLTHIVRVCPAYKTHRLDSDLAFSASLSIASPVRRRFSSFYSAKEKIMFGIRIVFALALVLALANIVATSGPTSIFIDQIDEYALLATCAELELSTIVRDMKYGCGDGGDGAFQSCTCCELPS
jgi:hypothetical protein